MTDIRTMHPYGYRTGQWAALKGTVVINGRQCYKVEFDDGRQDYWVVSDENGNYEFKE